ncbi:hypothetical protein BD309DRAFT_993896 [Dichomitus squalens]|nr:hypothetical protein BD309DRAFT_993896 [Dichomitus squalens]
MECLNHLRTRYLLLGSQIDRALADETSDRLHYCYQYWHTPIVPRRKALPPSIPSVSAVIKRLQAIFNCKDQLLNISHEHQLALLCISDKLKWILDNITENSISWTCSQQQNIDWFCKEFGKVKFSRLGQNFEHVVKALVKLEHFGYLDWIVI